MKFILKWVYWFCFSLHIVENPGHLALFDKATLISEVNGFPHSFRKAVEIKKTKFINRDFALNRDPGDVPINPIYNNLKLKDSNKKICLV